MFMVPFAKKFLEIAEKETRCMIVQTCHQGLPAGKYYMLESYCNRPSCDCRRAFINILYQDKILATIGYGWESLEFYKKWASFDEELAPEMKGPILELGGHYTEFSELLLKAFKDVMLEDQLFVERLKRHYTMFKKQLKKEGKDNKDGKITNCQNGARFFEETTVGKEIKT